MFLRTERYNRSIRLCGITHKIEKLQRPCACTDQAPIVSLDYPVLKLAMAQEYPCKDTGHSNINSPFPDGMRRKD